MRKDTKNETPYQWILRQYPPVITKDQLYKLCHVSKKTARHYLENGLIPCENTGKRTHRYRIKTEDVVHFLRMRDQEPGEYQAPAGWYKRRTGVFVPSMSPATRQKIQQAVDLLLQSYPDVLSIRQVSEITGYATSTAVKWCKTGRLHHFMIRGKNHIPKISLLEFFATDDYRCIAEASRKSMIRNANIKMEEKER